MKTSLYNKLKKGLAILASGLCITACSVEGYAQAFDWVKRMGGNKQDIPGGVTVDNAGNAIVVGGTGSDTVYFNGTNATGSVLLPGTTGLINDAYIAKYDASGNYLWARVMGGSKIDLANAVKVDTDDNIYITGTFHSDSVDFNPGGSGGVLYTSGAQDVFLVKYDASGIFLWGKSFGSVGTTGVTGAIDAGFGLATDVNGNVFITGQFLGSLINFNPSGMGGLLTKQGGIDAYLAKFDSIGTFQWARNIGGTVSGTVAATGRCLVTDSFGNIYIAGHASAEGGTNLNFNVGGTGGVKPFIGITSSNTDAFIAKYDANGNYIWAKIIGGDKGGDYAVDIAIDQESNIGVIGYFSDTANFDPGVSNTQLITGGDSVAYPWATYYVLRINNFIAKYDSAGNFKWVNQIGKKSGGNQISSSIAFDRVGNVFAAGNFYDTAFFNVIGGTIDTLIPSTNDVYLAKYNPDGACFWAKSVKGDNSTNQIYGIDLSNDGNIFMTGAYKFGYLPTTRIIDFDNGNPDGQITSYTTANVYEEDAYLVKYLCSDTTSSFHWSEIVCGDSLVIGGISYTASGIYTQIHPNKAGCDSLVTIELVVLPVEEPTITVNGFELGTTGTYTSYQWLLNGAEISGATNPTLDVTTNGDYQVVVTNEYGCSDTSEIYTVNNVSIQERNALAAQIKVFPNPSDDVVHINTPVRINIQLSSIDGRIIWNKENSNKFSVKGLSDGVYFLSIMDKDNRLIKVEKIVKQ